MAIERIGDSSLTPELDEPSQEIFQDWPMAHSEKLPSPSYIGKTVLTSSDISL